ncbi:MAG: nickel pincer cofactor biosynthesis protein LarC [Proteobacteria bacterium]|nr:nickel pincer cofactor biosynthesis protein LarC [Pseudomonadota bacterium]
MPASAWRGQQLYLDCFSGIAGDMFLGAMLDLGLPEAWLRQELQRLPIDGYRLEIARRSHHGIEGCDLRVVVEQAGPHHRSYRELREMIASAGFSAGVCERALGLLALVGAAEARVHGIALDQVELHELGAVDSLVDLVGAALALEYLQPAAVSSRVVPLGHGFVRSAHGSMPVPAPATLELLRGLPVEDGGVAFELCTPTGAAIIAALAPRFGPCPRGRVLAVGYGAGDASLPDRPNHLRAIVLSEVGDPLLGDPLLGDPLLGDPALSDPALSDPALSDPVVLLEANLDDMPAEWCGYLMERLLGAGACDAWYTPIVMKKGRPALTVSVLATAASQAALSGLLLTESTTLGVRYHTMGRRALERRHVTVSTRFGVLGIKEALDGGRVVNAAPEFEDCRAAAEQHQVALKEVYAAAVAAHQQQGQTGA